MDKLKVALLTANIGAFDPVLNISTQDYECDVFYYTEKNLPYPLPNLNDRLKSKYVKIQTHRFLPDYDAYVWIDSSVEVVSERFVNALINQLLGSDIVISLHPERVNVYDELKYILDSMSAGKEYLIKRYANEPVSEELDFYHKTHMPENYPLYVTRFFARWNNKKINNAFGDWWNRCIEYVNFDQAMFSHIAWKHGLNIKQLYYHATVNEYLKVHKH